jgi:hypothetical protein
MRRGSIGTLILAIVALCCAVAPANAATHRTAATSQSLIGAVCKTVHSHVHHNTGVICVGMIVQRSGHHHRSVQAAISFVARSGTLKRASVSELDLYANFKVVTRGDHGSKRIPGGFILATRHHNLWDGGPILVGSSFSKACMIWTNGDRACTSGTPLPINGVRILHEYTVTRLSGLAPS